MAEAKSQTCGEQRLAETGVVRRNLRGKSASSKRRTSDAGMNDLLSSASQWRAEIEEAPVDGKWGPLALPMFHQ